MSDTTTELNNLLDSFITDSSAVEKLSEDELIAARKKTNLYGVVLPETRSFANISISNFREDYFRKLHITAIIGFLFRLAEEFAEEDIDVPSDMEKALGRKRSIEILRANQRGFLERHFNYNPDKHAQATYKDNMDDPERAGKYEEFRKNMKLRQHTTPKWRGALIEAARLLRTASSHEPNAKVFNDAADQLEDATHGYIDAAQSIYSAATSVSTVIAQCNKYLRDSGLMDLPQVNDTVVILARDENKLRTIAADFAHYTDGAVSIEGTLTLVPPNDIFHQFDRYLSNHYEQLREATAVLHGVKPDIEFAVQYYKSFDTEDAAEKHRKSIESSLITGVFTIANEGWTLLGPFKQNRSRLEFYNKNTEVVKRMFEQMEADQKMGTDIMKNRVKNEKAKNIKEFGADDEGLGEYQKAMGVIDNFGSKSVLTQQEKEELAKAQQVKEMHEVPEDAVQVDVFHTKDGKMVKDKFYTAADKKEDVANMIEEAQNIKSNTRAVSKKGEKKSLTDLRDKYRK